MGPVAGNETLKPWWLEFFSTLNKLENILEHV